MHALKKKAHPQTQTTHLLRSSKSFLVMALPGSSAKQVPLRLRHMLVLLTITSVALCSRTDTFAASSPGKTLSFGLLSSVSHSARLCFLSTANIPLKRLRFNVVNVQSVLSLLRMRSPYSTRNCTQTHIVAFTALPHVAYAHAHSDNFGRNALTTVHVHVHPQTVAIAKDERFASLLLSLVLRTVRAPSLAAAVVDSESCFATSSLVPRLRPYPEIILWTGNEMFRICPGRAS